MTLAPLDVRDTDHRPPRRASAETRGASVRLVTLPRTKSTGLAVQRRVKPLLAIWVEALLAGTRHQKSKRSGGPAAKRVPQVEPGRAAVRDECKER